MSALLWNWVLAFDSALLMDAAMSSQGANAVVRVPGAAAPRDDAEPLPHDDRHTIARGFERFQAKTGARVYAAQYMPAAAGDAVAVVVECDDGHRDYFVPVGGGRSPEALCNIAVHEEAAAAGSARLTQAAWWGFGAAVAGGLVLARRGKSVLAAVIGALVAERYIREAMQSENGRVLGAVRDTIGKDAATCVAHFYMRSGAEVPVVFRGWSTDAFKHRDSIALAWEACAADVLEA